MSDETTVDPVEVTPEAPVAEGVETAVVEEAAPEAQA